MELLTNERQGVCFFPCTGEMAAKRRRDLYLALLRRSASTFNVYHSSLGYGGCSWCRFMSRRNVLRICARPSKRDVSNDSDRNRVLRSRIDVANIISWYPALRAVLHQTRIAQQLEQEKAIALVPGTSGLDCTTQRRHHLKKACCPIRTAMPPVKHPRRSPRSQVVPSDVSETMNEIRDGLNALFEDSVKRVKGTAHT